MRKSPPIRHYIYVSFPYDVEAKKMLDGDPRGALYAMTGLALDDPAKVITIEREVLVGTRRADQLFKIVRPELTYIENIEATTAFGNIDFEAIYERSCLIDMKYKLGVRTRLLVMTDRGMPANPPHLHVMAREGGNGTRVHRIEYIWVPKLPARQVLELNSPSILPWVVLMDGTPEEEAEAITRVRDDRDLMTSTMLLLGLRYGKEEKFRRIEMLNSFLTKDVMRESWVVQEWLDEGREEGEQRLLRSLIEDKFGPLPDWAVAKLNSADASRIEAWGRKFWRADNLHDALNGQ